MKKNKINLLDYIPAKEKNKFAILLILILIGVAFEALSFAIFIPTLDLIINNNLSYLDMLGIKNFFEYKNLETKNLIVLILPLLVLIFLIKNTYLLFLMWYKNKFFKLINTLNSVKLFTSYLDSDWEEHIKKNSADLIRNIQGEVSKITTTLNAFLELISEALIFFIILSLLFMWNKEIVLMLLILFFFISLFFIKVLKKKINYWASQIQHNESAFFKNIKEAIGSFKEIKILGKQNIFISELNSKLSKGQNFRLRFETIQNAPRFFLEFIAILLISLISVYLIYQEQDLKNVLVTLGIISVALFRILPSSNRIIKNINDIRFGMNSVRVINSEFNLFEMNKDETTHEIAFDKTIKLENISYRYDNNKEDTLKNVNLTIQKNSIIGIIGASGTGKSTLIDIITGLILKREGELIVDDTLIRKNNAKAYQENLGYLPQILYLFDQSIRQNIAIEEKNGDSYNKKNHEIILNIIKKLKLGKIIDDNENGIEQYVGENAIRLSGGEKQRLGIARLLYHNRNILIFDEATSALDNKTEKEIFEIIYSLKGEKTIIISTHSEEMLYGCDKIYQIKNQKLIEIEIHK